jgi:hypothetical protein
MENPSLISDSQIEVSPAPVFGEGEVKDLRPSSPVGGYDSNLPSYDLIVSLNPTDVVESVKLNASPETPVVYKVILRNENGDVLYASESPVSSGTSVYLQEGINAATVSITVISINDKPVKGVTFDIVGCFEGVSTSSSGSSKQSTTMSEGTTSKKSGTTTSGITPSSSTSVSSTSSGRSTTSGGFTSTGTVSEGTTSKKSGTTTSGIILSSSTSVSSTSSVVLSSTSSGVSCLVDGVLFENMDFVDLSYSCEARICVDGDVVDVFNCSLYGPFSVCESSCDKHEFAVRSRVCRFTGEKVALVARNAGLLCSVDDSKSCYEGPCGSDCVVGPWSPWTECSASCNNAMEISKRTRTVIESAENGGKECGPLVDERLCDRPQCNDTCSEKNMEYSNCSNQCPFSCEHVMSLHNGNSAVQCVSNATCQHGCKCRPPYLLQDGVCVHPTECRCRFEFSDSDSSSSLSLSSSSMLHSTIGSLLSTLSNGDVIVITPQNPSNEDVSNSVQTEILPPNSWLERNCMNCSCDENGAVCAPIPGCGTTMMSSITTPGEWCSWSPWSACTYSEGQNTNLQSRKKICIPSNEIIDEETVACQPTECVINKAKLLLGMNKAVDATLELWIILSNGTTVNVDDGQIVEEKVVVQYLCGSIVCNNGILTVTSKPNCEYDCQWSSWSNYTTCNATCGMGYQSRTRIIIKPADINGLGKPCTEASSEMLPCNSDIQCPCDVSEWSDWTDCSVLCGGGITQRTRTKKNSNLSTCSSISTVEEDQCNIDACSQSTPNNVTALTPCNGGKIMQFCHNMTCPYTCANRQGLTQCQESHTCVDGCFCPPGELENSVGICVTPENCDCNMDQSNCHSCQESVCVNGQIQCVDKDQCDCQWTEWTQWTPCSRSCGDGQRSRERERGNPPTNGGRSCMGPNYDEEICHNEKCPTCYDVTSGLNYSVGANMPSDSSCLYCYCNENLEKACAPLPDDKKPVASWNDWSSWSACSATCGAGVKNRMRVCYDICRSGNTYSCPGEDSMQAQCNEDPCNPEDCQLNDAWEEESPCDAQCDGSAAIAYGYSVMKTSVKVPARYGGKCEDVRKIPCNKSCNVDCVVTSWSSFSPCTSTCSNEDLNCDPTCGTGIRTSHPIDFIEAKNNGTKCSEMTRSEPCQLANCTKKCETPMQNNVTKNLCRMKCSDLIKENVCHVAVGDEFVGCACQEPYLEQNGDCVLPKDCNCPWDMDKLGPRPSEYANNYVFSPGFVHQVECNNCTCADGIWNCGQQKCKQDCVLSEWTKWGTCNASCGEGIQKWTREIIQTALFGGTECDKILEKTENCRSQSQPCCDPSTELSTQCARTCEQMLNNQDAGNSCQPSCICKEPLVYDEVAKQCVELKNCSINQCVVNGVTYTSPYSSPNYVTCTYDICLLGAFTSKPLDVKDMPPCSLADQMRGNNGSPRIQDSSKCCYYTAEEPCSLVTSTLTSLLVLNNVTCELVKPLSESSCSGSCPGSFRYTNMAFSTVAAAELAQKTTASSDHMQQCSCCVPVQDGINDPKFLGLLNLECKDGRTVAYPSYHIKACACSVDPSGQCNRKR